MQVGGLELAGEPEADHANGEKSGKSENNCLVGHD
jgi:hypothetical protein